MDLCGKYVYIFLYLFTQNEINMAKCFDETHPGGQNDAKDLISQREPIGLEIITEDSSGSNDTTKYNFKLFGTSKNIYEYKFKPDSKCLEVKHQSKKVWSRGDEATPVLNNEKEYPSMVSYQLEPKTVFVVFRYGYLKYVYSDGEWTLIVKKENVRVRKSPISTSVSNVDNSGWPIFWYIWDYEGQSEPRKASNPNEASLRKKSNKSNNTVEQKKEESGQTTNEVSNPSSVASGVTSGEAGQATVSSSTPDSSKSTKDRKGIELNISSKKNTDQYNYKVNDYGIGIYSAKSEYAFNLVKTSTTKIWSTNKQDEFADYVDVCNLGISGEEVRIFMLNRTVIILRKDCRSWKIQEESQEFNACCPFCSWKCFFTLGLYNCFCKDKCC